MMRLPTLVPRQIALLLTLLSCLGWLGFVFGRPNPHPWGDLTRGVFTDHLSHMNAARLFPRVGLEIYRTPIKRLFGTMSPGEIARLPQDVQAGGSNTGGIYDVPGWPQDKPLVTSWTDKPRLYPPGDMLLVAPLAVAYHFTGLSFATCNLLLIGLFVVFAHVVIFYLAEGFCLGEGQGRTIDFLTLTLLYSEVIRCTLDGFYDAAAMAPLLLCSRYLYERRGLAAATAYCVAAFIHFRAFFLAPWALYAAWLVVRERQWRTWSRRDLCVVAIAISLAALSLFVFALNWPTLQSLPSGNPVNLTHGYKLPFVLTLVIMLGVCGAAFAAVQAWLDLAIMCWLALVLFTLHEVCFWHALIPMVWLGAPTRVAPAFIVTLRGARTLFALTAFALVFGERVVPTWLELLFH